MKRITLLFFITLLSSLVLGQKFTISGYISDAASGERLVNANIYETKSLKGTTANNYGFYSLSLPAGNIVINASFIGYEPQFLTISLSHDTVVNFGLKLNSDLIDEVTVVGTKSKVEETQMSVIDIPVQKLQSLPVMLGETDVLKVMQLLPGVKGGTEGTSGIYVRGGGPDQNLFLLDGVPVYNASHLLGFFSVFNADAIKSVKLYKGGFPARYGGRLSSVIDMTMKDGNMKKLEGNFTIGLIASKLSLEGPIVKDKTSFIFSVRRTYIDVLAQPLILALNANNGEKVKAGAYFHDLNLKVNHIFSDRSRLFFSAYHGKDKGYMGDKSTNKYELDGYKVNSEEENNMELSWGNTIASLRWNYLIGKKLFSNTTLTYSNYNFGFGMEAELNDLIEKTREYNFYKYYSGIEDLSAKVDFDYFPLPGHEIKFGAQYTHHLFSPGVTQLKFEDMTSEMKNVLDSLYGNREITAHEMAAYIEDDMVLSPSLRMNAGIHLSVFNVQDETYLRLQPRLSLRYKASPDVSIKASYSRMAQHVHLLTTSGISLPTDLWLPVTKTFAPPISDQVALGTAINLPRDLTLTVEGFYKTMENLIEYKEGATFVGNSTNWESKVEKGRGWSYGAELMLEKTVGKTTGWLAYTLSWSQRQFENLNFGNVFPAKYDSRHDISIALTHTFNKRIDMGATWVFNTGNAITLGTREYLGADVPSIHDNFHGRPGITEYQGRNNYRMPPYHRMDLGINFHKQKKHGMRTWNISIYNVYSRQNAFVLMWDWKREMHTIVQDGKEIKVMGDKTILKKFSLYPIIPSFSYSYKF
ncbi:MAG: TonB-dependent receptor [Bacteroidales bacterium]|nr:TonB-dependent receptor [Bacteroidales bacterium]